MERVSLHGWGKRVAERALWASGCYESRRAEVYFELDGVELPARPAHYEGAGVAERTYLESHMQRICSKQRLDELRTSSRDSLPYPVDEPPLVQKCRAPGYSGGELNLQPSLWFMAAICCFSASATAFLEAYVLSASGHLAVFLVGGYVVFSSYFVCDYGDARAAAAAALPSLAISPLPHRRTAVMMRVSTSYAAIPDAK
ncbi:hypothetical protein EMIHUDRAFT_124454, partial [Emiliania huxleyi CCMP1516]|uniref:Uncharacterized protein n=2 Tax=Emiliania huxleyi TaxID=2903 RepID=A0A0D3IQ47_EMIH1